MRLLISGVERAESKARVTPTVTVAPTPNESDNNTGIDQTKENRLHTYSASFRDELQVALMHGGYAAHWQVTPRLSVDSAPTAYRASWSIAYSCLDVDSGSACAAHFPSLDLSSDVTTETYSGRVWCVAVSTIRGTHTRDTHGTTTRFVLITALCMCGFFFFRSMPSIT